MLSPWIICTFSFPPLEPLRYRALPFLTLRVGANFAGASKPRDTIRSITHKPPYIFLKTATIPTYYGISIAIPRYIAMQLSTVPFIMTHSSLSYCLAWSCSWHSICGKATVHNSFIHVTLDSLHIPVHRRRHSYRVICCNCWVVRKIEVWWSSLLEHCPSEERMMEAMIPPQVGMRLRMKNK